MIQAFDFSCTIHLPDGSSAEMRQTEARRDERDGVLFFFDVRAAQPTTGTLRAASEVLHDLPGETREAKSQQMIVALQKWFAANGLRGDFTLEATLLYSGNNVTVEVQSR